jgi:hypothetical protein
MSDTSNALEGLKLISDWAKWLITIEAGAIAIIGTMIKLEKGTPPQFVKVFTTLAVTPGSAKFGGKSQIALSSRDERDIQHHHGARR